jgi:hypothetical protein
MKRRILICLTFFLNPLIWVHAQDNTPEISTDRPDQSNTPLLVPKGAVQIETGFMKETQLQQGERITNYAFNTTQIKVGVNENFEFRVNAGYYGTRRFAEDTEQGFGPMSVGLKIKLADERGAWPQAAVITHLNFKTGVSAFNAAHPTGDLTLAFAHDLSEQISLCYNGGVKWNGDTAEATLLLSGSIGYSISPTIGFFAETYCSFPENELGSCSADGGVTVKITPVIQFDSSAGLSLKHGIDNSFFSSGLSIRLFR